MIAQPELSPAMTSFQLLTMNESLQAMAEDLVARAAREKLTIITAESCTSGLLATMLSEAPGADSSEMA